MRTLADIRREIDAIDDEIIALLARRLALVPDVVAYKLAHGLPTLIQDRIDEVSNRNIEHAQRLGVASDSARHIYQRIIQAMCDAEDRLRAAKDAKNG